MRQMAEGYCRHIRMPAISGRERHRLRRDLRVDPELVMKTVHQLQVRLELPCELPEDLVLFVRSGKLRVGAGLTVVIAQVLISGKEPNSIAAQRTAEIRRKVTVLDALESAERLAPRDREPNRLAGEARPLSIVRRVV